MKRICLVLLCIGLFLGRWTIVMAEEDLTPTAKSAILIDYATGEVLYEKNADERLAPASMTKIGSMLLIMEAIDSGKLSVDDEVTISEEAASMGGSQIFLEAGEVYTVHDLLKGVAIASGNDAVVALAEKLAGSQGAFVDMMNERFKELGANNTNFVNAHGLDSEGHYSTARDMAIIARELLNHEKILEYTSIYEEYLEKNDGTKTWLVNTNKLVRFYGGVDGLKTGFTESAGYCLTATAKKDDFRLISVVMGEDSTENRSSDTVKLLKDATELLKNTEDVSNYEFNLKVDTIKAPVKPGDIVGSAEIIDNDGNIIDEVDVTVKKEIKKASLLDYMLRNIQMFARGKDVLKQ